MVFVVECGVGHGCKVDMSDISVGLAKIFQPDRNLCAAESVTIFDWEEAAQSFDVADGFVVFERYSAQGVTFSFVHINSHRNALTRGAAAQCARLAGNLRFEI